ncbi:hypothetical protein [Desulfonatronospira sp.]|uniref:hypothetical protein n=1 Tax=Desulfonatronospira sp. TaxID=1962951 RepID=UPI0025C2B14C|nr:hypothetical protein [Desulfonatronospira sp.]
MNGRSTSIAAVAMSLRYLRPTAGRLDCWNKREEEEVCPRNTRNSTKSRKDDLSAGEKLSADKASPLRGTKTHLPDRIMFNVHPQRWHDQPWLKELVGQNVKNLVKAVVVKRRRRD